ncbi:MAG: hypothetical protein QXP58_05080 [Thermoprotei archaeon]
MPANPFDLPTTVWDLDSGVQTFAAFCLSVRRAAIRHSRPYLATRF